MSTDFDFSLFLWLFAIGLLASLFVSSSTPFFNPILFLLPLFQAQEAEDATNCWSWMILFMCQTIQWLEVMSVFLSIIDLWNLSLNRKHYIIYVITSFIEISPLIKRLNGVWCFKIYIDRFWHLQWFSQNELGSRPNATLKLSDTIVFISILKQINCQLKIAVLHF